MSERILIADDLATNRIMLKVKLTAACYEVIQAERCADVLPHALDTRPDLIILGRGVGDCCLEICRRLKDHPTLATTPIIVIANSGHQTARLEAIASGADDVLAKPLEDATLLAMVRNLIRARGFDDEILRRRHLSQEFGCAEAQSPFAKTARIALIAPGTDTGMQWRKRLSKKTNHIIDIMPQSQALEDLGIRENVPDAFVIASSLRETSDGLRLVSELRARQNTRHAVIILQDCGEKPSPRSLGLDLGANAVLSCGFDVEELVLRLDRLLARKFRLDDLRESLDTSLALAVQDPLTGLHNRRFADGYLAGLEREAQERQQPYALMLLDLDRFKSINDRFGHLAGDQVLVEVAQRLKRQLREMDLLARYGGEEFLVALPGLSLAQARPMAERLRRALGDIPISGSEIMMPIPVTISIGLAVFDPMAPRANTANQLLLAADQALYRAKATGRNRVALASDPSLSATPRPSIKSLPRTRLSSTVHKSIRSLPGLRA